MQTSARFALSVLVLAATVATLVVLVITAQRPAPPSMVLAPGPPDVPPAGVEVRAGDFLAAAGGYGAETA